MEALTLRYVGVIRLQFLGPCHTTGNFHELVAMIGRAILPTYHTRSHTHIDILRGGMMMWRGILASGTTMGFSLEIHGIRSRPKLLSHAPHAARVVAPARLG